VQACDPSIQETERWKDCESEANLGYIERPCFKKPKPNPAKQPTAITRKTAFMSLKSNMGNCYHHDPHVRFPYSRGTGD
jgi:hypothetical protein